MPRNKQVDQWFARYENPMKLVVQRIREIMLGADKRIEECIKWQAPTFTYKGNIASFFPKSKQHASLMFHLGARIPGKHPRLVGTGDTSRVMKLGSVAEASAAKRDIEAIVRAWISWRDDGGKGSASAKGAAKKSGNKKVAKKAAKRPAASGAKKTAKKAVRQTRKNATQPAAKKAKKTQAKAKATKKKAPVKKRATKTGVKTPARGRAVRKKA